LAVFLGAMIEGDITLLLAGVLARYGIFNLEHVLMTATLGGFTGDMASYTIGRFFRKRAQSTSLYIRNRPKLERLTKRFGAFAIFAVKYIWGLRTASSIFWGVTHLGAGRFSGLTLLSCALWVIVLSGLGYFFTGGVEILIGEVKRVEANVLVVVLIGVALILIERFWLARKFYNKNNGIALNGASNSTPDNGDLKQGEEDSDRRSFNANAD